MARCPGAGGRCSRSTRTSTRSAAFPKRSDPAADPILRTLDERREKLELVRARLMQHNFTGFVLVLVPERLPIEETARAAEILRESNVNVCGMIVNRVLPDDLGGPSPSPALGTDPSTMLGTGPSSLGPAGFYESRRRQEQVYLNEIRRRFAAYPLTWIPQFETDVYGLENLERVRLGLMR